MVEHGLSSAAQIAVGAAFANPVPIILVRPSAATQRSERSAVWLCRAALRSNLCTSLSRFGPHAVGIIPR
jgi:hypothetical protein